MNGVDVAYRRAGEGPPLVLVHGAGEDGRLWTPQLRSLSDELTVVAWDEPGAGASGGLPEGFALADYADVLAGLIVTLGLAPTPVCGLSWGSTVTLELSRRHPELVSGLILTGAYAGWKGSLPAAEVAARVAALEPLLAAPEGEVDLVLPDLFAAGPPGPFTALVDAMAASVRRDSLRTQLAIMAATDLSAHLPAVRVPTLLLWGELDARSPLRVAHEMARVIPGSTLVVIPECGHVTNLDRPDEFDRAVRAFYRGLPTR
ncbi:alpha/beta hydrolase [Isoptericola sp. S6320L]|uniref:alpha/beta fold hydrolase n=1 Tax=Isoptericola sp. S6320L TaxID=2926411 RepID=UPI001FF42454|nr:alpha/beta hydrolase [Isoptericola sp. S6320L]MCK0118358.1 alpha/beta hydrolase [Isoptericola sp. S6320L]